MSKNLKPFIEDALKKFNTWSITIKGTKITSRHLSIVAVAAVGTVIVFAASAATFSIGLESERGSASAEVGGGNSSDSSGGAYIQFGSRVTTAGRIDTHDALVDSSNKLVSWVTPQDQAYAKVSKLSWDYLKAMPNQSNGKPAYYSYSYMNPSTQQPVGWPHNPAGLYGMMIESAVTYYQYSGDSGVLQIAKNVADHQLTNGMTTASDNWAKVPYSSGDDGSLTYNGASYGNSSGSGDGKGVLQPDKIGEFGYGLVQLYKVTGDQKYLNAAIDGANALASHVRAGSASQSPWPFRVVASSGAIKEQYSSHISSPIELFDELIALNAGNVSSYTSARTTAWNWMMAYPMQNNAWAQYFEDVGFKSPYNDNLNQLNAMMVARYLLQHPEKDPSWETHVRGLIKWVEDEFGRVQFGAQTIEEQFAFAHPMGSHSSRYASVNALLYEKTGDQTAKEKAFRSFNWATYMARSNGVVLDGPTVGNQWFTDGYGDFVRHFMVGMGAVPEWSPANENHLLRSSSIVKSVSYGSGTVNYQTFDQSSVEKLHLTKEPTSVKAGGTTLSKRSDLSQAGWTFDSGSGVLQISHTNSGDVAITY